MARGFTRFLAAFEAQAVPPASGTIAADADSTGATTDFDTGAAGNLDGCDQAEIEINVTTAPTSVAVCKVYLEPLQHDGVGYMAQKFVGSVQLTTTADKYKLEIDVGTEKGKIVLHAVDFSFIASASMRGFYPADA